jgi:GT2 family glycosyltransferase
MEMSSFAINNNPRVGIVILNWNNSKDTVECLSSVFEIQYDNYFIVVVDNGSTDDSLEIISGIPNIEVLPLPINLGYAGGNNKGISRAIILGAEYIFILNNDTYVSPSILDELILIAKNGGKIGMVGPKMYCARPTDLLFAKGSFVIWQTGKILHRGIFQQDTLLPGDEFPEIVDFIVGCGVLVSKQLIETIGGLDEDYFLNTEDVEWGIRAKRFGYEVWFAPKAVLWHKVSSTLGLASPTNTYYMTRNHLIFFSRNAPGIWKILAPLQILIGTLWTVLAWSVKEQYQTEAFHRKRLANLYALRDFFLGRHGKMGADVFDVCIGE